MEGSQPLPEVAPPAASLPGDLAACHAMIRQLLDTEKQSVHTIASLEYQLQQLLRRLYGRSSEKIDANQMKLFEEMLAKLGAFPGVIPGVDQQQTVPGAVIAEPVPTTSDRHAAGHGRRKFPANLQRTQVIHDLPEDKKPCPCCGKVRACIGREVGEQLDYVPAKVTVIEHVRLKYACRECEQNAAPEGSQVTTAVKPPAPIEKGMAAAGLLAHVLVSKYSDHLPMHRLERIFERHGIDIARSTMCDWAARCADTLRPLYDLMIREVLKSRVIHTDDTPVDVMDPDVPGKTRTGRFWVYLGNKAHPFTVFDYTPSRSRDGPMKFLSGWGKEAHVYLQADAFGGYDVIYKAPAPGSHDVGSVTEVACLAHARRKFYEARTTDAETGTQALAYIRLLYDVEDQARELSPTARAALRQELALPRLRQFHAWLESRQAQRGGPVLPRSPMGQAVTYALNQWDALCVYATDGDLSIDNNASENALRRVCIGRKNWLFCGSDDGGRTAAIHFSFVASCQRHKVNVFDYLRDVLDRIAAHPANRLAELLPDRWKGMPALATS